MNRRRRDRQAARPRIGLFGLYGAGNLGNDASFEVVLKAFQTSRPDAVLDAMCSGSEEVAKRYGIDSTPLFWYKRYEGQSSRFASVAIRTIGKLVQVSEILRWVRRHDLVIVPGAGALEATLPVHPWGTPYGLFLLCAAGRIVGTKVALVSVGANVMNERATRRLQNGAARMASYRSYRDEYSRDAMRARGLDTANDAVYPDLVFGLGALTPPGDPGIVGVGVMEYLGTNGDRRHASDLRADYVAKMTNFVGWLVDQGRSVRVLVGDTSGNDDGVAHEVVSGVQLLRPDLEPSRLSIGSYSRPNDLLEELALVGTVVATRFHNVISALSLSRPTISIGYSDKHDVIMAEMGMGEFCQSVRTLDVDRLTRQFLELDERKAPELHQALAAANTAKRRSLGEQFDLLFRLLRSNESDPAITGAAHPGTKQSLIATS